MSLLAGTVLFACVALLPLAALGAELAPASDGTVSTPARPGVPKGVRVVRDLEFVPGGGPRQSLDLYLPKQTEKPSPLIIFIFGGGWGKGDKNTSKSPVLAFSAEGYAVAQINHRLSAQATFPAQIQDCKAAVRFLRANAGKYNLDGDHFGVMGYSSGGHLSALVGTSGGSKEFEPLGGHSDVSDRVQAVCDWYGPTDLLQMDAQARGNSSIHHDGPDSPEAKLIGGPIQDNRDKAQRANPIQYIAGDCPPFLIMHGTQDRLVPIGQSEILADALRKKGVEVLFQKIPGTGHGGGGFQQAAAQKLMRAFLDRHLKGLQVDLAVIEDASAWMPMSKGKAR